MDRFTDGSKGVNYVNSRGRNRRQKRRELFCPKHPDERMVGNGKKYFLHLLSPLELQKRGVSATRARLIINAYPVLVLSNEWLEELYCSQCGRVEWFHITKHDHVLHTVRIASRELWAQVAHVNPVGTNPTVSEFSRKAANRNRTKRADGKNFYG